MKRSIFVAILALASLNCFAQLQGGFTTGQDGHIYFQATNVSGYQFTAIIKAISEDRTNTETITVGQGFYLGPSTPWRWYWKEGDRIIVTYPNGNSVYWECPQSDPSYTTGFKSLRKGHCRDCGLDHYGNYICPAFTPKPGRPTTCKVCGCPMSSHAIN